MITFAAFRKIATAFEETVEQPHFEKTSFRVNKKIFATMDERLHRVVVKLTDVDQSVFCAYDATVIYPVPGGWGKQGWTIVELKKIKVSMLKDILTTSYCTVAPKILAEKYNNRNQ